MTLHACQKWFTISSHITLRRMTSSQIRCKEFSTGSNEPSSTVLIDYFKVLGIERSFEISQDDLKQTYKNLMKKFHPDRHTLKPKAEQDTLAEKATTISRSYGVLQDDHERALHLLELGGMPMEENISGDIVGQQFLLQIMELREEVDDTKSEHNLKHLLADNKQRMNDTCSELAIAFSKNDFVGAKRMTAKLQYWKRIDELIIEKL